MRYKLHIEYDGGRYRGWQAQKEQEVKTVQGVLLSAAYTVFDTTRIELQGAGRTDAGVHALCQIAHLDAPGKMKSGILKLKLNDLLPPDINILHVEECSSKFHARHDALKRRYIYRISKRRTAFGKQFCWWVKDELNVENMALATKDLIGMHDYTSFSDLEPVGNAKDKEKSPRVLVYDATLTDEGDTILFSITASHFLWKMVRRIVGALVEIGRGNMKPESIAWFLTQKNSTLAKYTAPPSGLFLESIIYKGDNEPIDPKKVKII